MAIETRIDWIRIGEKMGNWLTDLFDQGGTPGVGSAPGTDNGDGLSSLLALLGGGVAGAIPKNSTQTSSTAGFNDNTTSSTQNLQQLLQSLVSGNSTGSANTNTSGTQSTSGITSSGYGDSVSADLARRVASAFSSLAAPNMDAIRGQGNEQINRGSEQIGQSQQEALAARGLSTSPVAGAIAAGNEGDRFGKLTSFSQSLPLLQNQLTLQNLAGANSFLASAPKTTTTTGSTTQAGNTSGTTAGTTSQNTQSNQTGSNSGSTVSSGQSGTNNTTQNTAGGGGLGAIGGLATILATLFG